jgi:hypothetical protein
MYRSDFATRMKGEGIWAEQISNVFKTFARGLNLLTGVPELEANRFQVVTKSGHRQLDLFG